MSFTLYEDEGERPIRGNRGGSFTPSSLGVDGSTFGPDFDPAVITDSDRFRTLDFSHTFALSTQHDWKTHDFYSRVINSGPNWRNRGLITVNNPSYSVPLDHRRPNAPYRLAPLIVDSFTCLVFGHGHFPTVKAEGDADTEDYCAALIEAAELPTVCIRARDIGGGTGTVGLSWRFADGVPRVRVHNGKHLWPAVWKDEQAQIPEHVIEIVKVAKDVIDPRTSKVKRAWFWRRRDWTPNADITFLDCPVDEPPVWTIDEGETFIHREGLCHFVWITNLPDDDEATRVDGRCDFEGQHEQLNTLDTLNSVVVTGGIRNLDPTLVLKINPETAKAGVKKGSDNALVVGMGGDADYLTLDGASLTAGIGLVDSEERKILRSTQCVIPDPDAVAAAGTSSLALRLLYLPMLGKCDLLRAQYGKGLVRLLEQMLASVRHYAPMIDAETGVEVYPVERSTVIDDAGNESIVEAELYVQLQLPPKVVEEEERDANGVPTGRLISRKTVRHPGAATRLTLKWGEYFPPTEAERQAKGTTLGAATVGKPVMSQRSAVEEFARYNGQVPETEWLRVQEEAERKAQADSGMFLGTGGGADDPSIPPTPIEEPTTATLKPEVIDEPEPPKGEPTIP